MSENNGKIFLVNARSYSLRYNHATCRAFGNAAPAQKN
jgi:hypothetical protein